MNEIHSSSQQEQQQQFRLPPSHVCNHLELTETVVDVPDLYHRRPSYLRNFARLTTTAAMVVVLGSRRRSLVTTVSPADQPKRFIGIDPFPHDKSNRHSTTTKTADHASSTKHSLPSSLVQLGTPTGSSARPKPLPLVRSWFPAVDPPQPYQL